MNQNDHVPLQQELQDMSQNSPNVQCSTNLEISQDEQNTSIFKKFSRKIVSIKEKSTLSVCSILVLQYISFFINNKISFSDNSYLSGEFYNSNYLSTFGNILFSLFVWAPMAVKIEKSTSTIRYLILYVINLALLTFANSLIGYHESKIWCFVLFETILISSLNTQKNMRFFFSKTTGNRVIFLSTVYFSIINCLSIFNVVITVLYSIIYRKFLMKKLIISDEKVTRIENFCLFSFIKNHTKLFISLEQANNKSQINQSSFIPNNMYPNNFSGFSQQQNYNVNQAPSMLSDISEPIVPPQNNEFNTVQGNENKIDNA